MLKTIGRKVWVWKGVWLAGLACLTTLILGANWLPAPFKALGLAKTEVKLLRFVSVVGGFALVPIAAWQGAEHWKEEPRKFIFWLIVGMAAFMGIIWLGGFFEFDVRLVSFEELPLKEQLLYAFLSALPVVGMIVGASLGIWEAAKMESKEED